jgi:hypothetical protein
MKITPAISVWRPLQRTHRSQPWLVLTTSPTTGCPSQRLLSVMEGLW